MSFSKGALIEVVGNRTGIPQTKVKEVLTAAFDVITEQGEAVIHNFGVFKTKERAERVGRNPITGEPMKIPAKTVLTFKATKRSK